MEWTVTIKGMTLRGQAAIKSEAIADAERAIDRALAPKKLRLVRPERERCYTLVRVSGPRTQKQAMAWLEVPHWLMIAGAILAFAGLAGLALTRNKEVDTDPVLLPGDISEKRSTSVASPTSEPRRSEE